MKKFFYFIGALSFISVTMLTSCVSDDDNTIVLESDNNTGIPSDALAGENPTIGSSTTSIPNIQYTVEEDGNDAIVRIDMTGVQDADSYDWLRLIGTAKDGQNIWLSVDGKPKGILVYNNADNNGGENGLTADLVFLVDNSGSMGDESNAIARDIISWSESLEKSSLDIKFGCVGYAENGYINGAINLSSANELSAFLNRSTGTSRTIGFAGNDASSLQLAASTFDKVRGECGGMALRYADKNIKFRAGSNRIYVNFTDEPNQPNNNMEYSVEYFANQYNWSTRQGTVHTVFSESVTYYDSYWRDYYQEKPWLISEYTGGTILFTSSNFSGVTLSSLPVTGAMTNSYVIRFTNVSEFMDGKPHLVKITILSADGKTRAEREFYIVFGSAK